MDGKLQLCIHGGNTNIDLVVEERVGIRGKRRKGNIKWSMKRTN